MKEEWKTLQADNRYMVSNLGRVKRIKFWRGNREKILKLENNGHGYLMANIRNGTMKRRYMVHRAVAECFIPNPEDKPQVNHINGIKHDNRLENLEWCTAKENTQHAIRTGLKKRTPPGEDSKVSKITEKQAIEIKRRKRNGETYQSLSDEFGVAVSTLCCMTKGRSWKNIP